jgi:hypothetical protein
MDDKKIIELGLTNISFCLPLITIIINSCLPVTSSNSFWDSNMMMSAAAAAAVAAANAANASGSLHHQQQHHHLPQLHHSMHQLPLHPMPPISPGTFPRDIEYDLFKNNLKQETGNIIII